MFQSLQLVIKNIASSRLGHREFESRNVKFFTRISGQSKRYTNTDLALSLIHIWRCRPASQRSRVRIPYKTELFFRLSFRNCDDLPSNNSSLRSSHIWFSYIHNFNSETCFNQSEALWVVTPHWSSSVYPRALVRRRFSGEPVVVGHSQANRQSVLKPSTHCFLLRDIFLRHTISLL